MRETEHDSSGKDARPELLDELVAGWNELIPAGFCAAYDLIDSFMTIDDQATQFVGGPVLRRYLYGGYGLYVELDLGVDGHGSQHRVVAVLKHLGIGDKRHVLNLPHAINVEKPDSVIDLGGGHANHSDHLVLVELDKRVKGHQGVVDPVGIAIFRVALFRESDRISRPPASGVAIDQFAAAGGDLRLPLLHSTLVGLSDGEFRLVTASPVSESPRNMIERSPKTSERVTQGERYAFRDFLKSYEELPLALKLGVEDNAARLGIDVGVDGAIHAVNVPLRMIELPASAYEWADIPHE